MYKVLLQPSDWFSYSLLFGKVGKAPNYLPVKCWMFQLTGNQAKSRMTLDIYAFRSFDSTRFLLCLYNIKCIGNKFHPCRAEIKGSSFWALPQTKVWAKWGVGWGLIFYHSLLPCFLFKLLRFMYLVLEIPFPWLEPPLLSSFPPYSPKEMLRLCAKTFLNCILLQYTRSCLLSFGMQVMTEIYWFTSANTQGHHRGVEFTYQSIWHLRQEKATAEKNPVRNSFSRTQERLSRIVNQLDVCFFQQILPRVEETGSLSSSLGGCVGNDSIPVMQESFCTMRWRPLVPHP